MTSRCRVVTLFTSWLLLTALAAATAYAQDQPSKLDSALRASLQRGGSARLGVILRIQSGRRVGIRQQLEANGFAIRAEHSLINAISVEVPINALFGLAHRPDVLSISMDAPLHASGAANIASNSSVLRATLGLTPTSPRGVGAGVAVFDSGIYPSPDFGNRITAFYDFTRGGVASVPYRRLWSRDACRGSDWRYRSAFKRGPPGRRAVRQSHWRQGARLERRWIGQHSHQRAGIRDDAQDGARYRRHQSVAGPSDIRVRSDRSACRRGGKRGSRGNRCRRSGW